MSLSFTGWLYIHWVFSLRKFFSNVSELYRKMDKMSFPSVPKLLLRTRSENHSTELFGSEKEINDLVYALRILHANWRNMKFEIVNLPKICGCANMGLKKKCRRWAQEAKKSPNDLVLDKVEFELGRQVGSIWTGGEEKERRKGIPGRANGVNQERITCIQNTPSSLVRLSSSREQRSVAQKWWLSVKTHRLPGPSCKLQLF